MPNFFCFRSALFLLKISDTLLSKKSCTCEATSLPYEAPSGKLIEVDAELWFFTQKSLVSNVLSNMFKNLNIIAKKCIWKFYFCHLLLSIFCESKLAQIVIFWSQKSTKLLCTITWRPPWIYYNFCNPFWNIFNS